MGSKLCLIYPGIRSASYGRATDYGLEVALSPLSLYIENQADPDPFGQDL